MKSSSEITNSGVKANRTGSNLEEFVRNALNQYGYTLFSNHKTQLFENRKAIGGKQFQEKVSVGHNIYKSKRIVDFFIINQKKFQGGLIIECKWQQSSGSVDEKYPFLIHNIGKTDVPTVILLDGRGYRPAAKKWLKNQVNPNSVLIDVWDMSEFQREVNNGFLG